MFDARRSLANMPDPIEITRADETTHGAYYADVPDAPRQAELTWTARGGVRFADHTYVPHEARGKGIAMRLVEALVADAREQGFRIEPVCSYVIAAFRRHPDWADVRAETPS
jgi:predicted GNAT family acetyltransferase